MARVLILGGTGWLGARIARNWQARGAEVVCLARGTSGRVPAGTRLVRADRTEAGAYDALTDHWDEVVELAYDPALVAPAVAALSERAAHWSLVSSVSVYARDDEPGADESAELVEPADPSRYPDAKVAAERVTAAAVGDRLLIARPGLIVGPGDPTDRFGYWPARLSRGGVVLVPVGAGRHVQVIDVDDLARWIVDAGAGAVTGSVNAVGPAVRFDDVLEAAASVSGFDGRFLRASDEELATHDVAFWAGPRSLPLWLPLEATGFAQRDDQAFRETGGITRPLRETLLRTLDDETSRGLGRPRRSGLTEAEEAEIVSAIHRARAQP